jgi:predicted ester cyclase
MAIEQILKAIEARDAESFAARLTPDCDFQAPGFAAIGSEAAWIWMKAFLDAFPDIEHRVVSRVASGSREAVELSIVGTHTAPLVSGQGQIPATGQPISITACDMIETDAEGRVRSYHIYFDQAGFLAQLGLTPSS